MMAVNDVQSRWHDAEKTIGHEPKVGFADTFCGPVVITSQFLGTATSGFSCRGLKRNERERISFKVLPNLRQQAT
jgi:hypothetical protein